VLIGSPAVPSTQLTRPQFPLVSCGRLSRLVSSREGSILYIVHDLLYNTDCIQHTDSASDFFKHPHYGIGHGECIKIIVLAGALHSCNMQLRICRVPCPFSCPVGASSLAQLASGK